MRFLEHSFQGLLLNFNWWVNRKDPEGRNVFAGGFLGLDNIGIFDRSAPLPTGGHLDQADGTAWMAFYCQNMLEISLILAEIDPMYEEVAFRFLEHFLWIAYAMDRIGANHDEMWDEQDGFFYDLLHLPDGSAQRLKVRSMVGLLAAMRRDRLRATQRRAFRAAQRTDRAVPRTPPGSARAGGARRRHFVGYANRRLASVCNKEKLVRILAYVLDEKEFLSPYGIRSLSAASRRASIHVPHRVDSDYTVQYLPAESNTGMFGGNSNWRGPIWMPVNALLIRGLLNMYQFYGNDLRVECPTGSGNS